MNCFFGSILYALVRDERTKKIVGRWYVRLALIAAAFFIIKRDENFMTYALDGVAMTLLVLAVYHGPWMQAVLGLRPMAALGRYSLGVYMLHEPMFLSLGSILYRQLTAIMEVKWASLLTGTVCFFLCFPLAWAIERGVGWLTAKLTEIPKFLRVRGTEKDGMGLTQ